LLDEIPQPHIGCVPWRSTSPAVVLSLCAALTACGSLPGGGRWGAGATVAPGWPCIAESASDALASPRVWAPLAGAGLLLIADRFAPVDRRVSSWATDHTPLFGSQRGADRASDALQNAARLLGIVTAVATPSGSANDVRRDNWLESRDWLVAKGKGMVGVEGGSILVTHAVTFGMKDVVRRPRPDQSDAKEAPRSFPSGHASHTSVVTTLALRNVDYLPWPAPARNAMRGALLATQVATAWARVEAAQHFPSDVLFAAALGDFVGAVGHDAFIGLPKRGGVRACRSG
jgi:membrane-associated phospholipid phosphatase